MAAGLSRERDPFCRIRLPCNSNTPPRVLLGDALPTPPRANRSPRCRSNHHSLLVTSSTSSSASSPSGRARAEVSQPRSAPPVAPPPDPSSSSSSSLNYNAPRVTVDPPFSDNDPSHGGVSTQPRRSTGEATRQHRGRDELCRSAPTTGASSEQRRAGAVVGCGVRSLALGGVVGGGGGGGGVGGGRRECGGEGGERELGAKATARVRTPALSCTGGRNKVQVSAAAAASGGAPVCRSAEALPAAGVVEGVGADEEWRVVGGRERGECSSCSGRLSGVQWAVASGRGRGGEEERSMVGCLGGRGRGGVPRGGDGSSNSSSGLQTPAFPFVPPAPSSSSGLSLPVAHLEHDPLPPHQRSVSPFRRIFASNGAGRVSPFRPRRAPTSSHSTEGSQRATGAGDSSAGIPSSGFVARSGEPSGSSSSSPGMPRGALVSGLREAADISSGPSPRLGGRSGVRGGEGSTHQERGRDGVIMHAVAVEPAIVVVTGLEGMDSEEEEGEEGRVRDRRDVAVGGVGGQRQEERERYRHAEQQQQQQPQQQQQQALLHREEGDPSLQQAERTVERVIDRVAVRVSQSQLHTPVNARNHSHPRSNISHHSNHNSQSHIQGQSNENFQQHHQNHAPHHYSQPSSSPTSYRKIGDLASDEDIRNSKEWLNPGVYGVGELVIVRRSTDEWRYAEVISVAQDGVQLRVGPGLTKDVATRLISTHVKKLGARGIVSVSVDSVVHAGGNLGITAAAGLGGEGAGSGRGDSGRGGVHHRRSSGRGGEAGAGGVRGGKDHASNGVIKVSSTSVAPPIQVNDCPICLDPVGRGRALFAPECGHLYHFDCIRENVRHGNLSCPLCRHVLQEKPTVMTSVPISGPSPSRLRSSPPGDIGGPFSHHHHLHSHGSGATGHNNHVSPAHVCIREREGVGGSGGSSSNGGGANSGSNPHHQHHHHARQQENRGQLERGGSGDDAEPSGREGGGGGGGAGSSAAAAAGASGSSRTAWEPQRRAEQHSGEQITSSLDRVAEAEERLALARAFGDDIQLPGHMRAVVAECRRNSAPRSRFPPGGRIGSSSAGTSDSVDPASPNSRIDFNPLFRVRLASAAGDAIDRAAENGEAPASSGFGFRLGSQSEGLVGHLQSRYHAASPLRHPPLGALGGALSPQQELQTVEAAVEYNLRLITSPSRRLGWHECGRCDGNNMAVVDALGYLLPTRREGDNGLDYQLNSMMEQGDALVHVAVQFIPPVVKLQFNHNLHENSRQAEVLQLTAIRVNDWFESRQHLPFVQQLLTDRRV